MSALATLKRLLIGKPIATKHAHQERLIVPFGLAVFASDALSSVAYASEEIMLVLVLAGPSALHYLFSTSLWLAGLMVIVGFSYFQTIFAYPKGGGTYLVSSQNLGSRAGQTAGAALLIDYVLTVSVSISSGVAAIVSMSPGAHAYTVPIALTGILVLTFANLRGAKESGAMFAIPTYIFVVLVLTVVVMSLIHGIGHAPHDAQIVPPAAGFQVLTAFLMLRAFAASCTALTGTEAIADGVQAFRPPEARNASLTLALMIGLLLTMFLGISWSAMHYGIVPMDASHPHYRTVLAQLASIQFGRGALFYLIQIATALILFLAANTAYADFPRLSSFLARDGFLPRQLMSVGDRLVYQNGIVLLGITSAALIFVFNADTHSLIPLYALGVFVSFTMSQTGMGVKFFRDRKRVIDRSARFAKRTSDAIILGLKSGVSFIGAATTFIVLLILLVTKFEEGAWLIVVAMTMVLFGFGAVRKHYDWLAKKLAVRETDAVQDTSAISLLLVPRMHRGVLKAISYARSVSQDCRALHVKMDDKVTSELKREWASHGVDMPLVVLDAPYRSIMRPVIEYIDQAIVDNPGDLITVIVPEAVPKHWWQRFLHNNVAIGLKVALSSRRNVVVTSVRYLLD